MKTYILLITFIANSLFVTAQTCYEDTTFASTIFFDQGWIYNCNTGTSCNAGVTQLTIGAPCDPNTALDPCVPTPSCGTVSDMANDLWFKFWGPPSTIATISITRFGSLGVGIQVFSTPSNNYIPTCSQLTEIPGGCIADDNPSQNTQLSLTSLTPGQLYFFRVYGYGSPASHRTGNFCFCGSVGLTQTALPVKLLSFSGSFFGKQTTLQWTADQQQSGSYFEIEKSTNGNSFISIGREPVIIANGAPMTYHFEENRGTAEMTLYRLKMVDVSGEYSYSDIVQIDSKNYSSGFIIKQDPARHSIVIYSDVDTDADLFTIAGNKLMTFHLTKGDTPFYGQLEPGIYLIRKKDNGESKKLVIY